MKEPQETKKSTLSQASHEPDGQTEERFLRSVMTQVLGCCKDDMSKYGKTMVDSVLFSIDHNGEVRVDDLDDGSASTQYELVRKNCQKRKAQCAVYVVPGMFVVSTADETTERAAGTAEFRRQLLTARKELLSSSDLTTRAVVECPATITFEYKRCIYLYGATKNCRLTFTASYWYTENDPAAVEFGDLTELPGTRLVTESGEFVTNQPWFDGVEWGELNGTPFLREIR